MRAHPSKVQRRVRKGVPDQLRGLVWQLLSGGRELAVAHEGRYGELVGAPPGPRDAEIVRDLNRTFPSHVYYQQRQGPGQLSLYNVLKAYSLFDPKVHPGPQPPADGGRALTSALRRNCQPLQCWSARRCLQAAEVAGCVSGALRRHA